jgi:hypothetical protein
MGGGMYSPQTAQLQAVPRTHRPATCRRMRAIVESPGFRRHVGELDGDRLQRVPLGFPKDHAAAEYLKYRQFLAGREPAARLRVQPQVLLDVAHRIPAGGAARPVPQRTARQPLTSQRT